MNSSSLFRVKNAIKTLEVLDLIDFIDSVSDSEDDSVSHDDNNADTPLDTDQSDNGSDNGSDNASANVSENKIENKETLNRDSCNKSSSSSSSISVNSDTIKKRKLQDCQNPLETIANNKFEKEYGFRKSTVKDILDMISYGLTKQTNRGQPVPAIFELLVTLQYLTSGLTKSPSQQSIIGIEISLPTISRIKKRVTTLLAELKLRFIKIPTKQETTNLAKQFSEISDGHFPYEANIIGCVGATHIAIRSPDKTLADDYLNENGVYSFRIMFVCGPGMKFFEIISRWPGATHQNKIFHISETYQRFEYNQLDGILLADKYFEIRDFIFPPVMHPNNLREVWFNERHKKMYIIPNAVKLWKQRFRCLDTVLHNKEDTIQSIISACAVLHNIAIERDEPLPSPEEIRNTFDQIPTTTNTNDKSLFNMTLIQDPKNSIKREIFIQKYF